MTYARVLYITSGPFPPDIRIEKEVMALVQAGFRVHVIASSKDTPTKVCFHCGARVHYLRFRTLKGIPLVSLIPFLRLVNAISPDIIHLDDAPLGLYAILFAKLFRVKLIYDNHEVWADYVRYCTPSRFWAFMGFLVYFAMELALLHVADATIAVAEEAREEMLRLYHVPSFKIEVVRNFVALDEVKDISPADDRRIRGRFVVTYVGHLSGERAVEIATAIQACHIVGNTIPITLVIVGEAPPETRGTLLDVARRLGVFDSIHLTGRLPFREAMSYVAASDICFLGFPKTRFTDYSLPHKVSQYLYFGKPLVAPSLRSLDRVFDGAIAHYVAGDAKSLARTFVKLYENEQLRRLLGTRGRYLVTEELNWELEKDRVIRLHRALAEPST